MKKKKKQKQKQTQKNPQNQTKPNSNTKISPNKHYLVRFTKTASGQAFYTSICHDSDKASYHQRYPREVITLSNSLIF